MNKLKWGFLAYGLIEIASIIMVGRWLGVIVTLLLIVGSAVLGLILLRLQGALLSLEQLQAMQRGEMGGLSSPDHLVKMLAALMLILPGFITDILGLVLLIPQTRMVLYRFLVKKFIGENKIKPAANDPQTSGRVIEGEFEEKPKPTSGPSSDDEPKNDS